jgi:tetratricopeptide (TPR) repeat protein
MKVRANDLVTVIASLAVLSALGWGAWALLNPTPELDRDAVLALASAGKPQEAGALVESHLRIRPDDRPAHYLAAQVALDHPEPTRADAEGALAHLDQVRPEGRKASALVAMYRGKAQFALARFDEAEASWIKALILDPTVPEAAWGLLGMYYLQLRPEEARRLGLAQHAVEPDPRDRVKFLLEIFRQEYQRIAPNAVVRYFEPKVKDNPRDLHATVALGRGLVLDSRIDEGLVLLRTAVESHLDDPLAWDALLTGLDEGGAPAEALSEALGRLPAGLARQDRFLKHRARVAQERGDWKEAVRLYRLARESDPGDPKLRYRLARALRLAGETAEADRVDREYEAYQAALAEQKALFDEAEADKSLGARPRPELYRRLADLRERMGHPDEAAAWYRLALRADPDDPRSAAALKRLTPP